MEMKNGEFLKKLKRVESNDPNLLHLELQYLCIGDEGAEKLANAIAGNNNLISLTLYNNEIGKKGVKFLANAIKRNNSITSIDFNDSSAVHPNNPIYLILTRKVFISKKVNRAILRNKKLRDDFIVYSSQGHLDKVKECLKKGVSIHNSNDEGMTALHVASQNGHLPVVKHLIKKGASPLSKNKQKKTPIDLSKFNRKNEVNSYLNSLLGLELTSSSTQNSLKELNEISFDENKSISEEENKNVEYKIMEKKEPAGFKEKKAKIVFSLVQNILHEELSYQKKIGEGNFGVVYKGKWNTFQVAIKKIKATDFTEQATQEFHKEAGIFARLNSPFIVRFYGISLDKGEHALVMEYCAGGSLYHCLHSTQALSWETRRTWTQEIAHGIEYLHKNHVVHGDLAARNILLDEKQHTKLTDFGLSETKNYSLNQSKGN